MKIQLEFDELTRKSKLTIESKDDIVAYKLTGDSIFNHSITFRYVSKSPQVKTVIKEVKVNEPVETEEEIPSEMTAQW